MKQYYSHLKLINPDYDSKIIDLIMDINHLKKRRLHGSSHPLIFFQLKSIFHKLESIGSARIEGNHTTISEFIDADIDTKSIKNESFLEIKNNELALEFIEKNIDSTPVNRGFICELHKLVVKQLDMEGSDTPGEYRKKNISISGSAHTPPDFLQVADHMQELFSFINEPAPEKYDLIKIALAHHRFVWIHPFDNGNGRTVRLLTYAMLIKMDFKVRAGRIINPTAIFCCNREQYYNALSKADAGTNSGLQYWIEYMLSGLINEIEKIDRLLEKSYTTNSILKPAIENAKKRKIISEEDSRILNKVIENIPFKTTQLREIYPNKGSDELSREVKRLRDLNYLVPEKENSRSYIFYFIGNEFMREVIKKLDEEGFLPIKGEI